MRAQASGFLLLLLLLAGSANAVRAELPPDCAVAQPLIENEFGLPRAAAAIAKKHLTIMVIGAGSSTLTNAEGKAYPARLQATLGQDLAGVTVTVKTDVKPGRTASEALSGLLKNLATQRPSLVVWQAGTVDAMKGVDVDDFSAALDKGIEAAHAAGADVILINAQYSPRTESIIALGAYADHMRWVALRHDVPLFDRYGIMKLWAEFSTFDFTTTTKKLDMAERVHDCIGRLLGELVVKAAKSVAAPPSGAR